MKWKKVMQSKKEVKKNRQNWLRTFNNESKPHASNKALGKLRCSVYYELTKTHCIVHTVIRHEFNRRRSHHLNRCRHKNSLSEFDG